MRVAILHTDFRIYWPARLYALHQYLKDHAVDLQVIEISSMGSPYRFNDSDLSTSIFWHCIFPNRKIEEVMSREAVQAVVNKLDDLYPDIVLAGAIAFPSGAAAVSWGLNRGRKVIIFDDARLVDIRRSPFVNWIKKKVFSGVDAIFCPSEDWQNTFEHFGFSTEQLFYGVDVVDNDFWSDPEFVPDIKEKYKYFLTIGRQVPKKNLAFLLLAYKKYLETALNPLHLMLIGDGPMNISLRQVVVDFDIEEFVHFIPFLSQENLKSYFREASWFVFPSLSGETWGLVVNEAMASGLPVIVSNQVGCVSTLVKDGVNGFIFSPDVIDELVRALVSAATMDEGERLRMAKKSTEIISEWGLERFCQGAYEAIQYVYGQKKRTPDLIGRLIINLWKGRYRPV